MAATLAIAVLYARQRDRDRVVGIVFALAAFLDLALICGGDIRLLDGTLEGIGATVCTLGVFLLGLVIIALRGLPWWCGVGLIVWGPAIFWVKFLRDLVYGPSGETTKAIYIRSTLGSGWLRSLQSSDGPSSLQECAEAANFLELR